MEDNVKDGKSVSPAYSLSVKFSYSRGAAHSISDDSLKHLETIAINSLLAQFADTDPTASAKAASDQYKKDKSMISPFYVAWGKAETVMQSCIAKDYGPSAARDTHIAFDFIKN